ATGMEREAFRATLAGCFLVQGAVALALFSVNGLVTSDVGRAFLVGMRAVAPWRPPEPSSRRRYGRRMAAGRIVIVTGPPGSGKTTVSALLAAGFDRAVHLEAG